VAKRRDQIVSLRDAASQEASAERPLRRWWPALLLALGTALVFLPGLRGEFVSDDTYLIQSNTSLRDLHAIGRVLSKGMWEIAGTPTAWLGNGSGYYRPILQLAFLFQYQMFAARPLGYHLVSLGLHVACVLLACAWLRRRIGARRPALAAAAVGAALFAVHPSRPANVAWISGSGDLWMTFWLLLGLWTWERLPSWKGTVLALPTFVLAFLSKETAVFVPVLVGLDALLLVAPGPTRRQALGRAGASAVAIAAAMLLRLVLVPPALAPRPIGLGTTAAEAAASFGLYLQQLLWPWSPSMMLGLVGADKRHVYSPWDVVLGVAAAVGLLGVALAARRRAGLRPWLADVAWFVLALAPVLNLVPLGYTVLAAVHNLYLPMLGVAALVSRGVQAALVCGGRARLAWILATGLLVLGFVPASILHTGRLQSSRKLWSYELRLRPDSPLLHANVARALWKDGDMEAALREARAAWARALAPDDRADAAVTWASIRLDATSEVEQEALGRLRDFFDAVATQAGGVAHLDADGEDMVVELSREACDWLRTTNSFRNHRAVAHARTLDLAAAERLFRDIALHDATPASQVNLARAIAFQGRWEEAITVVEQALRVYPGDGALLGLREPLGRGRSLVPQAAASGASPAASVDAAIERARLFLDLGAPELARRAVTPLLGAHPDRPELVVAKATADAADRRFDLARETLLEARARDPAHGAFFDEALARIRAAYPPPRARLEVRLMLP